MQVCENVDNCVGGPNPPMNYPFHDNKLNMATFLLISITNKNFSIILPLHFVLMQTDRGNSPIKNQNIGARFHNEG